MIKTLLVIDWVFKNPVHKQKVGKDTNKYGEKLRKENDDSSKFKNLLFMIVIMINLMEFISDFQYDES